MNCKNHVNRQAYSRCSKCGDYICDECGIMANGETICKSCASEMLGSSKYTSSYTVKKDVNGFFLFCLSCLPGLNYMYMGLIKRGIFMMAAFFGMFAVLINTGSVMAGAIFTIIFFASFFDGFKIRKKLLRGVPVEDSFDDITSAISAHKGGIILFLLFYVALVIVSSFTNRFMHGGVSSVGNVLVTLGLIFLGMSFFKKNSNKNVNEANYVDKRNDY